MCRLLNCQAAARVVDMRNFEIKKTQKTIAFEDKTI